MDTLAKRLKFVRKIQRQMNQEKPAQLSGVDQSVISKIERGVIQKTTSLLALARALDCSAAYLDSGDGERDATKQEVNRQSPPRNQVCEIELAVKLLADTLLSVSPIDRAQVSSLLKLVIDSPQYGDDIAMRLKTILEPPRAEQLTPETGAKRAA